MSKELLEEIIENLPYSIRYEGNVETLIKYTREQAERVQELEGELSDYKSDWRRARQEMNGLYQQNKQYREAMQELKEYLESTIPKIPTNEKPLILTKSLEIINRALESD